jgi:cobalt-zinc-cadmium efflux system outer membrane protein
MSQRWYGAGTLVLAAMMTCPLATDAKEPFVRLSGWKSLVSPRAAGGPKSSKSASTTARNKEVAVRGEDDAPSSVISPAPPAVAVDEQPGRAGVYQSDLPVPPAPQPAGSSSDQFATGMTLSELERLALTNNPTLEQAAAGVEVERGSFQQAGLYPNPQIGFVNGSSDRSGVKQSNGAFFSQEIVTAGKLKKAQAWEANEVNKVSWDLEAQRQRVLTDVKIRYYDVLGAQHSVVTLKKLEAIAERGLATVRQLFDARNASRADVLQAKIQLETVRASLDEATERHSAAWQQLANVVGLPDLETTLLDGQLDGELPTLDARASWEKLLASSPQLRSAEAERDHAFSELTLAEAQAIPNVTLQTVAEYDQATQASTVSTLVALPLPLFNRNQGNIYRASSDIRVACSEIERTKLVLRDLLAESFRRYQTNLKQAKRFQDSILPDAQENLELTEAGYKAGESSFLQVLTARQTYIETQLAYVEALTEIRKVTAEIEGLQLTGGLNPAAIGAAIQASGGGSTGRQRQLLNQVQQGASRQLLNAAQIAR